jgi:hypothetical protein
MQGTYTFQRIWDCPELFTNPTQQHLDYTTVNGGGLTRSVPTLYLNCRSARTNCSSVTHPA